MTFARLTSLRASIHIGSSRLAAVSVVPTMRVESAVRTAGPMLRSRYGASVAGRIPVGVRQRLPRRSTAVIILLVLAAAILVPLHLLGVPTNPTGHSMQLPAVPIDTGLAGTPAPAAPDEPTASPDAHRVRTLPKPVPSSVVAQSGHHHRWTVR